MHVACAASLSMYTLYIHIHTPFCTSTFESTLTSSSSIQSYSSSMPSSFSRVSSGGSWIINVPSKCVRQVSSLIGNEVALTLDWSQTFHVHLFDEFSFLALTSVNLDEIFSTFERTIFLEITSWGKGCPWCSQDCLFFRIDLFLCLFTVGNSSF